ncbi:MAG: glycosyltransferase family 2 protein [Planctomycetes bacterium]|nr:glycosyltransferase family 2 protein [Planctomycetota bacterium]MBU4398079.1 glycosyltransferase family 2 protein [Planctomycetota bacterium]MCG2683658.1 glycosyltransferase family 2 protein [Planctomycetales bacterium]
MNVSIIIVSYNTCELLRNCLTSVREKTCGVDYEIFVVDNASNDGSCEMLEREFPDVRLVRNRENRGFAKANNQAILMAQGEYVLLLNSDTVLENNAIGVMHEFMRAHPRAAVCGPLLLNADGTVQQSIDTHVTALSILRKSIVGTTGIGHRFFQSAYHPRSFDYFKRFQLADGWLTGAVLMIRRAVFPEVGLLDEAYHFYNEDADWGLAVSRSQWQTWFIPEAVVTHFLGGSRKTQSEEQEISFKVQYFRQNRYFFWKNLGTVQYGAFRLAAFCVCAMNLLRRAIMTAVSSSEKRLSAIFKMRLGWKLFLASLEHGGDKGFGNRQ